ncbi:MAG TPA: ABC transporter ATP-binding protein [Opitutaceae bacterium]|nr:ABC transporter ATP-binding protein [Opitutaceae bacterium]
MIEARHLRKQFGSRVAVHDVSLQIAAGEKLVLLGPSGCGKTTFLRMLNRLVEPTSGEVWFDGVNIAGMNPVELRRRMGFVIQGAGLLPHRTVRENILTVPRLLGWSDEKCDDALFVMKALLWLFDDWFDAFPHELSTGQRQRVGLARAIIADPAVVLMDEPFSALDPVTRLQVRREFRALWTLHDKVVIMVTHDISEAIEFADRIALMSPGRIEQVGTPAQLLFQPQNEFVQKFFDGARLHYEWQAARLRDLALPFDPARGDEQPSKFGLPASHTVAEAMTAIGHDRARAAQLADAFQTFKAGTGAGASPGGRPPA